MSESPPTVPNADQIAYWNDQAGSRWVALQQRIDAIFAQLTTAAIDSAAPRADESVLDVGCGCGATVLELARRVGSGGNVVGIDVSRPMLELARERVRAERFDNVSFQLADASAHPFEAAQFDLAFSRFGVMFFDDPVGAFANIRGALRPAGRLAFLCWRPLAENPWFAIPLAAALRHVPPPKPPEPDAPGPYSFADPERVRRILQAAGFSAIDIQRRDAMMNVAGPGQVESAADLATKVGAAARALLEADAQTLDAARTSIAAALREHETPEGVFLPGSTWFVSARA